MGSSCTGSKKNAVIETNKCSDDKLKSILLNNRMRIDDNLTNNLRSKSPVQDSQTRTNLKDLSSQIPKENHLPSQRQLDSASMEFSLISIEKKNRDSNLASRNGVESSSTLIQKQTRISVSPVKTDFRRSSNSKQIDFSLDNFIKLTTLSGKRRSARKSWQIEQK